MGSIAVQTAVGEMGAKATTELSFSFASMINAGGFQYGAGPGGLKLLNSGEDDDGTLYERTFTLATSDLGVNRNKRARFVDIEIDGEFEFDLSVKMDNGDWRTYEAEPLTDGLQGIRIPVGSDKQGWLVAFKISSMYKFTISRMDGIFYLRSGGIRGH